MNAVNQGGKREREWEATLNQERFLSFPASCHIGYPLTILNATKICFFKKIVYLVVGST